MNVAFGGLAFPFVSLSEDGEELWWLVEGPFLFREGERGNWRETV